MTQELADKLILHYENTIIEIELCDNNIEIYFLCLAILIIKKI